MTRDKLLTPEQAVAIFWMETDNDDVRAALKDQQNRAFRVIYSDGTLTLMALRGTPADPYGYAEEELAFWQGPAARDIAKRIFSYTITHRPHRHGRRRGWTWRESHQGVDARWVDVINQRNAKGPNTMNLERRFFELLAHNDPLAAYYYAKGWTYPSESPLEEAHNNALMTLAEELEKALENNTAHPLDILAILDKIQPATQKTRNTHLTPLYDEARAITHSLRLKALTTLKPSHIHLLAPKLRSLYHRHKTIAKYPTAEIQADDLTLTRKDRDEWWLTYEKHTAPYYLRTGHLSPNRLKLTYKRHTADSAEVISVLVTCDANHTHCHLPAACEIVIDQKGTRFSAWRENASPIEALAPHETSQYGDPIRLGDVIIRAIKHNPAWPYSEPIFIDYRYRPAWLTDVMTDAEDLEPLGLGYLPAFIRDNYYCRAKGPVKITHPDHYTCTIDIPEPLIIAFQNAQGRTQYTRNAD